MERKVFLSLIILCIAVLSLTCVSASEITNETTDLAVLENDGGADECLAADCDEDMLDSSYCDYGPDGYIECEDRILPYENPIEYTVRLVGDSPSNQNVYFFVYDRNGETLLEDTALTDDGGYATLNADLKKGEYYVGIGNQYFGNAEYRLVIDDIDEPSLYADEIHYKHHDDYLEYVWFGSFEGSFNIYKGDALIDSEYFGSQDEYVYNRHSYYTKNLEIGSYRAEIVDMSNNVVKQASFKVQKTLVWVYCSSFKSAPKATKTVVAKVEDYNGKKLSGTVKFKINGKTHNVKLKNGVAKLKIKMPSKAGSYSCKVTYAGNKYNFADYAKFTITVKKPAAKKKTSSSKKTSSAYKVITTNAKTYSINKHSGKFTVNTRIFDMTAGFMAPYKYVDTILYKNGKQVKNTKYWVKYKVNGKWTGWTKYGTTSTAHHRYAVKDSAKVGQIKVKVHK